MINGGFSEGHVSLTIIADHVVASQNLFANNFPVIIVASC